MTAANTSVPKSTEDLLGGMNLFYLFQFMNKFLKYLNFF